MSSTTRLKIFFDTEFTGLRQNTSLISIGLITDRSAGERTFYAELHDFDITQIDEWIRENVLKNLSYKDKLPFYNDTMKKHIYMKGNCKSVQEELYKWLKQFDCTIDMWSDCLAYDWVLFNELFGGAIQLPEFISYIPFDLCTLLKLKGIDPDINREEFSGFTVGVEKHNSLWDAKVIKGCYEKIMGKE